MNKELRDKIQNQLKTSCGNSRITLPKGFLFSEKGDTLTITFQSKRGFGWDKKPCNMQEDSGAFEGWAAVLYVHYLKGRGQICLDIRREDVPPQEEALYTKFPHYSRFLYRVLRFSRQYDWFHISSLLEELVNHFQRYLSHNTFTNNLPQGEAGMKESLENVIESRFAKEDAALLKGMLKSTGVGEIYRQLPVGLFKNAVCKENRVFTGQKSAIDLWTTDGETLTVIELKTKNKMIGAVTELFFYANYAYDLFVDQDNTFHKNPGHGERGYDMLSDSIHKVRGCLLLDEGSCHPLVDSGVLKALNGTRHCHLTYDLLVYHLEMALQKGHNTPTES